jgi:hypothetical protein
MGGPVENRNLGNLPTEHALDCFDTVEFQAVMLRGKLGQPGDFRLDPGCDWCRFLKGFAAVHDAMADRIDFRMFREKRFERRLEFRLDGAQVRAPQRPIARKIAEPAFEAAGAAVYN